MGMEGFEVSLINKVVDDLNWYGFGLFVVDYFFEVVEVMGLVFVDKIVKLGESYVYRVYFVI